MHPGWVSELRRRRATAARATVVGHLRAPVESRTWVFSGSVGSRGARGTHRSMAGCATAGPLDDGAAAREKPRGREKLMTDSGRSVQFRRQRAGRDRDGRETRRKCRPRTVRPVRRNSGREPSDRRCVPRRRGPESLNPSRDSRSFRGPLGAKPGPVRQRGAPLSREFPRVRALAELNAAAAESWRRRRAEADYVRRAVRRTRGTRG